MTRWKRDVESTLKEFNMTAWKQNSAIEDLRDMFSKFMRQTKTANSASPSGSQAVVGREASPAKSALRKRCRKQLASRDEITFSDNDMPVHQVETIPQATDDWHWKVAMYGTKRTLVPRLGRAIMSSNDHEFNDINAADINPIADRHPLPLEILAGAGLQHRDDAMDTQSAATNDKVDRLVENEVVTDAISTEQCGKAAEESEVYNIEVLDAEKQTSVVDNVRGDLQCRESTTAPLEEVLEVQQSSIARAVAVQPSTPAVVVPVELKTVVEEDGGACDPEPINAVASPADPEVVVPVDGVLAPASVSAIEPVIAAGALLAAATATVDTRATSVASKPTEPTRKSSWKTTKSPVKVHVASGIPQNRLTKADPRMMGRQGHVGPPHGRSKLIVFNVQGTLLDCNLLVEPNPNNKIRSTTKALLRRVVLRPWLHPFVSQCFLHFAVGFWDSKSTSFMEDVFPVLMGAWRLSEGPKPEPLFQWSGKQCEFFDGRDGANTS